MVLVGSAGRLAAVDLREEMTSYLIYTTVFSSYFCTDRSLCFCAVAGEASREWEVRLVRWERELGLVLGPVLMCECSGQFGRRCPACRKFWNTPRSPSRSRSRSRSPARYFHRVFKDGAMRVEECPLRCKSARVYMHSFLESTPQTPPRLDSPPSSPNAAPPRPLAPPPARPMALPPPPPPAPRPLNVWL